MLKNPNALIDVLRQHWEPVEGSVLSYQEVEKHFTKRLVDFLTDIELLEEDIKFRRHRATLHTVPDRMEKMFQDLSARYADQMVESLLKSDRVTRSYVEESPDKR